MTRLLYVNCHVSTNVETIISQDPATKTDMVGTRLKVILTKEIVNFTNREILHAAAAMNHLCGAMSERNSRDRRYGSDSQASVIVRCMLHGVCPL